MYLCMAEPTDDDEFDNANIAHFHGAGLRG